MQTSVEKVTGALGEGFLSQALGRGAGREHRLEGSEFGALLSPGAPRRTEMLLQGPNPTLGLPHTQLVSWAHPFSPNPSFLETCGGRVRGPTWQPFNLVVLLLHVHNIWESKKRTESTWGGLGWGGVQGEVG